MGQALYRKYRSKSLSEIVGQEHITATLGQALKSGRISHAYLLTGPRGVGKTSVARILAHEVNGLPYDENSTHLDIIEIDAASNRRIDEIRDLRDKVHVAPAIAKYKVYIIDEVHMLTREAFNALLKTLEEPPAHAIFILATTEAYKLPETIVSRTQRFTFRPIDKTKVTEHLKNIAKTEKIVIDNEALEIIAEHGEGSFRDSISLLDQLGGSGQKITAETVLETLGEAPSEQIDILKKAILSDSASKVVQALHVMLEHGYEPSRIAKQLGQSLRNDLLSDAYGLDYETMLALLSKLLDVGKASDQAVALELALLSSIKPNRAAAGNSQGKSPQKLNMPEPKKSGPAKIKTKAVKAEVKTVKTEAKQTPKPAPEAQIVTELGRDLDADWQAVMEAIKMQHNTLYSVMRMSQPVWEEGTLKLNFGFPFHQKRINEPRNRQVIAEVIQQVTGRSITVETVLDENLKPAVEPDEPAAPKVDDPVISNISNIFGGAELVES